MPVQKQLNPNFEVEVKVCFAAAESNPCEGHFLFGYKIRIKNRGQGSAQLMSRHWIITDAYGQIEELRGAGVVGVQPKIQSGQLFEYESACPLPTSSGSMRGFYQFVDDSGDHFEVEIPEFYLVAPTALH